jgi:hypothetical protein
METMTPKEKAKELVDKFDGVGLQMRNEAIACAFIAVDEVLDDYEQFPYKVQLGKDYWNEVKEEIKKL